MILELTDEAKSKLHEKTSNADNRDIRIGVRDSGCNGFAYEFDFLKGIPNLDEDLEVDYGTYSIWISKQSVEYLHGMQLDYQHQGINEGFVFINPNATAYCGCGESFSI
jgi:iron-sulfur cluster assembly protein